MSETTPIPSAIQATVSCQSLASPRTSPTVRPPTARAATSAPSQSNRPVASMSRDSSTWLRVAHSATSRIGTLTRKAIRQPMVSTRRPPTIGPSRVSAAVEAAQMPNARPRSGPWNACVMSASDPGMSSAPAAPWKRRKRTSHSSVGASPHRAEVDGEPDEADRVDAPPAVAVGERAGQDEQGGEDGEVPALDVVLALEDRDDRGRELLADRLERDVDDRAVEEDGAGSDDRGDEGPALAGGHRASVAARDGPPASGPG